MEKKLSTGEVRTWLGVYFLIVTASIGAYILLFKQSPLLPIDSEDALACFQIIIPTLVGQVTLIWRWFTTDTTDKGTVKTSLPFFIVKLPLIIVAGILLFGTTLLVATNNSQLGWRLDAESYKGVLTFCVTILNATSVYVVVHCFRMPDSTETNTTGSP